MQRNAGEKKIVAECAIGTEHPKENTENGDARATCSLDVTQHVCHFGVDVKIIRKFDARKPTILKSQLNS